MPIAPGTREAKIMDFLHKRVFDAVLKDTSASKPLRDGVRMTINRMERLPAESMIKYFWSAVAGTPRSVDFGRRMHREGFARFEDVSVRDDFKKQFPLT